MCEDVRAATLGAGKPLRWTESQVENAGTHDKRGAERSMIMMPNHYDRERLAQAHFQELLREAEHERLLAQLPQPRRSVPLLPARLMLALRALRTRLRQGLQRHIA